MTRKRHIDNRPESPALWWQMERSRPAVQRNAKSYIRKVCDITIVFWNKDTIFIDGGDQKFVINRWFDTRRNYEKWNLLCDSLKVRKKITVQDIRQLVIKHGFQTCGFVNLPEGVEKLTEMKERKCQKN